MQDMKSDSPLFIKVNSLLSEKLIFYKYQKLTPASLFEAGRPLLLILSFSVLYGHCACSVTYLSG